MGITRLNGTRLFLWLLKQRKPKKKDKELAIQKTIIEELFSELHKIFYSVEIFLGDPGGRKM